MVGVFYSPSQLSNLFIDYEAMWEDEFGHNITIASDYPKHDDGYWVFGFHQYESDLRLTPEYCGIFVLGIWCEC